MKLEIGAGARARPGWLAYDINPANADVVGDALHLPFRDGAISELRAVDLLEHISYRDTDRALQEWARVCAPGAPIYVQVPDAHAAIMRYIQFPASCVTPHDSPKQSLGWLEWVLLGGHCDGKYVDDSGDFRWNAHYSLWSRGTLGAALRAAGFDVLRIQTNGHPNLLCDARRGV